MATDQKTPTLTPEQQARVAASRERAVIDRQLGTEGPPFNPDLTPAAPCYAQLRAGVERLRAAREAAGLTQADVSAATGLALETLSRLEAGAATNPTWQTLARYAVAVGCDIGLTVEPRGT